MVWELETDEGLSGEPANTVGLDLWTRDKDQTEFGWTYLFQQYTCTTAGSWETAASKRVRVPTYVESGDTIHLAVWAWGDGNASNGVRVVFAGNNGGTVSVTATSRTTRYTCTYTLGSAPGTFETIAVQGFKRTSATADLEVSGEYLAMNCWFTKA